MRELADRIDQVRDDIDEQVMSGAMSRAEAAGARWAMERFEDLLRHRGGRHLPRIERGAVNA